MGTTGPPYWMENEPRGYNTEEGKFEDCLAMIYRAGQTSEGKLVHHVHLLYLFYFTICMPGGH